MAETKVTYLIGAGASAHALPVVNGLSERIRIFYNYLCHSREEIREFGPSFNALSHINNLVKEIEEHYTIDTLAKKYYLNYGDNDNYKFLKSLLVCYLYFEQIGNKDSIVLNESIEKWVESTEIIKEYRIENKNYFESREYNKLIKSLNNTIDYRYDSFFAALLKKDNNKLVLPNNINIISWNYDAQFELAFSSYESSKNLEIVESQLQLYPSSFVKREFDINRSTIIKLNGSGAFNNSSLFNDIDLLRTDFSNNTIFQNFQSLNELWNKKELPITNLRFAWENDVQVLNARQRAKIIMEKSDIIVVIGYSFPTFNRDIDRQIFELFNKRAKPGLKYGDGDRVNKYKKIYIQDTPENAPKIKERLKAIGNNLFEVAEIYDDVDQFLIPYEL